MFIEISRYFRPYIKKLNSVLLMASSKSTSSLQRFSLLPSCRASLKMQAIEPITRHSYQSLNVLSLEGQSWKIGVKCKWTGGKSGTQDLIYILCDDSFYWLRGGESCG